MNALSLEVDKMYISTSLNKDVCQPFIVHKIRGNVLTVLYLGDMCEHTVVISPFDTFEEYSEHDSDIQKIIAF